MYKVFLNDPIAASAVERLKAHVEIVDNYDHPEELDAVILRQQYLRREVITRLKKCRLVMMHGTGLERIDVETLKEFGIPLINTPGVNSQSVGELVIAMMLDLSRKLKLNDAMVRKGLIRSFGQPETVGLELSGKLLGIVGNGCTAQKTVKIARYGFDMQIMCYNPRRSREEIEAMGYIYADSLKTLMKTCDYVSIHAPETEATRGMINAELLADCNPNLILINTSRGGIIDEAALYEALTTGKLLGAGLDVFQQQPPSADNPLLSLDNVTVTMHIGGSTAEAMERNGKICVDKVFEALNISE